MAASSSVPGWGRREKGHSFGSLRIQRAVGGFYGPQEAGNLSGVECEVVGGAGLEVEFPVSSRINNLSQSLKMFLAGVREVRFSDNSAGAVDEGLNCGCRGQGREHMCTIMNGHVDISRMIRNFVTSVAGEFTIEFNVVRPKVKFAVRVGGRRIRRGIDRNVSGT